MKLSWNWLAEWVDLPGDVDRLCGLLTMAGIEVEGREERGVRSDNVVVAEILESVQHPNADRLSVCQVADGSGAPRQIVCGAKNYRVGDRVPLALPGAVLPGDFKIKVGKLRGVESQGMLCSGDELGIPDGADGLLILPPETPVGERLAALYPPDTILEIEVTPNRPDLLGYAGVAREIGALTGAAVRWPAPPALPAAGDGSGVEVAVEDAAGCPFYTARRIAGVAVGPSPAWLAEKLVASGIRPINNVVDITNFVLLETGQPLHAFDAAKLSGGLRVRRAAEGERFLALDGKEYRPGEADMVIADGSGPVALAGVMGGEATGVSETTAEIVLESAWFDPSMVRRTSRALGLSSDSSYRFERRVDPEGVARASDRAAALILEIAGGALAGPFRAVGEAPAGQGPVVLRGERCRAVLGADIPDEEIGGILSRLGLVRGERGWDVPSFRADLAREIDLIEEIARVVGMERIAPRLSAQFAAASGADAEHDGRMRVRRLLAGAGFFEARTLTLVRTGGGDMAGGVPEERVLRVKNPLGEEQSAMRSSLVPGLVDAASRNARAGLGAVRLFEVGRVFLSPDQEPVHLGLVATGPVAEPGWRETTPRAFDFHDLAGVIAGLGEIAVRPEPVPGYALGARLYAGERPCGWMGQLAPGVARGLDCTGPVVVGEIDLGVAGCGVGGGGTFREIERFPAVVRDVAFLAAEGVTHAGVMEAIAAAEEPLLVGAALFDMFTDPTGEKIAAGQKSLGYTLTYRSSERTLTSEEVAGAHDRVKKSLTARLGVTLRE